MQLNNVKPDSLQLLQSYIKRTKDYPSDLAPFNIIMWARVINTRFIIKSDKLYLIANFDDFPSILSPPLGKKLTIKEIKKSFDILSKLGVPDNRKKIYYLWENYPVWDELFNNLNYKINLEGNDYYYNIQDLVTLRGRKYHDIRNSINRFVKKENPQVIIYSNELREQCVFILEQWMEEKKNQGNKKYLKKLHYEYEVCKNSINDYVLQGVVIFIKNKPVAFSLGFAINDSTFMCLYEKTLLKYKDVPSFVFWELAKFCEKNYQTITVGEDWNIPNLKLAKMKWNPDHIKKIYSLSLNLGKQ